MAAPHLAGPSGTEGAEEAILGDAGRARELPYQDPKLRDLRLRDPKLRDVLREGLGARELPSQDPKLRGLSLRDPKLRDALREGLGAHELPCQGSETTQLRPCKLESPMHANSTVSPSGIPTHSRTCMHAAVSTCRATRESVSNLALA